MSTAGKKGFFAALLSAWRFFPPGPTGAEN